MNRQIEKKMVEFLDFKLKENGEAKRAIDEKDPRSLMIQAAYACVGTREKTGHNDGPMVELIQETIGSHNQESWCMSFLQTLIAYSEIKTGIKSPLIGTEHCMTLWNASQDHKVQNYPKTGAIIIWEHLGTGGSGHTGLFIEGDGTEMICVEGNTTSGFNANEKIISEGGGVYRTKRRMRTNGNFKLHGFLKPF